MQDMMIALDPSLNHTGYALFDGPRLVQSGTVKSQGESVPEKLDSLCRGIKAVLGDKQTDRITSAIIEIPGKITYARSQNKYSGKALNQDSIQKLCMAVGALMLTLRQWGIECHTIEAHEWKGRMGKQQALMIARNTKPDCKTDHEADALLLGKYYQTRRI